MLFGVQCDWRTVDSTDKYHIWINKSLSPKLYELEKYDNQSWKKWQQK